MDGLTRLLQLSGTAAQSSLFPRNASRVAQSNKLPKIVFEFVHIPVMQEFARLILSMQEP